MLMSAHVHVWPCMALHRVLKDSGVCHATANYIVRAINIFLAQQGGGVMCWLCKGRGVLACRMC